MAADFTMTVAHVPPAASTPTHDWGPPPPPTPRRTGLGRRAWWWLTGPALAAAMLLGAFADQNHLYLTSSHRASDLLVADLLLLAAVAVVTRFRWPVWSLLLALAVPVAIAGRGSLTIVPELAVVVCLMAIASRRRPLAVVAAGALTVGQLCLLGRWDPDDTQFSTLGIVIAVAVMIAVALVIRAARAGVGRRRARRAATSFSGSIPTTNVAIEPENGVAGRGRRPRRSTVVATAVVAVAGQFGLLWYSQTFWPVDPGVAQFARGYCGDFTAWSSQVLGDTQRMVDAQRGHIATRQRRDLHARTVELVAHQTAALADRLDRLTATQPIDSAAHVAGQQLATTMRTKATTIGALFAPWSVLPVDTLAHFKAAEAPLRDRFAAAGNSVPPDLLPLVASTTSASQRTFSHEMQTTPECFWFTTDD